MEHRRGLLLGVLLVFFATSARGEAQTDVILDTVAGAFQVPREQLPLKDLSESEDAKQNPKVRVGYLIDPEDDAPFGYAQVLAADEGTCLTPEIRKHFDERLHAQRPAAEGEISVRKVEAPNGIIGYVGLGGLGPGGAAIRAVMHIPDQRLDWQITVYQVFEPEKTQENYGNNRGSDFIVAALEASVQQLAARAAAGTFTLGEKPVPRQQPVSTPATNKSPPKQPVETPAPDPIEGASDHPPAAEEANPDSGNGVGHWAYVLIAASAIHTQ